MRSNSLDPNQINYYDGFSSDFYSYQNLERQKYAQRRQFEKMPQKLSSDETDKENLKYHKRIICSPLGFEFNIKAIIQDIANLNISEKLSSEEVINVTIIKFQKKEKIVFIFEYGVVVMWSLEESEEASIRQILEKNCKYLIKSSNTESHLFFSRRGETFSITNKNKIIIESNDPNEILSIAYALAQHTILAYYELEVASTIEETKRIPIEMRDLGEIKMSKKEISRNIGLIFMRRSAVNLNSDILDTPDLFWDYKSEMEAYYSSIRKYMEIDKRVSILDKRMKILKELYDVMNNEIKTQGKFRLEWIVVYLIVIEIFISIFWKMLVKDILKLY
jgi:uncharacterized Rmd1/YagE family protein